MEENQEFHIPQEESKKILAVGHKVIVRSKVPQALREAREELSRRGSTVLGPPPPRDYGEGIIVAIRVWHDLATLFEPHRSMPVFDVQGEGWKRMNLMIDDLELWEEKASHQKEQNKQ